MLSERCTVEDGETLRMEILCMWPRIVLPFELLTERGGGKRERESERERESCKCGVEAAGWRLWVKQAAGNTK